MTRWERGYVSNESMTREQFDCDSVNGENEHSTWRMKSGQAKKRSKCANIKKRIVGERKKKKREEEGRGRGRGRGWGRRKEDRQMGGRSGASGRPLGRFISSARSCLVRLVCVPSCYRTSHSA